MDPRVVSIKLIELKSTEEVWREEVCASLQSLGESTRTCQSASDSDTAAAPRLQLMEKLHRRWKNNFEEFN